jgi:hypothetical protein
MKLIYFFCIVMFFSCSYPTDDKRREIQWKMMRSNNIDEIMEATLQIQRAQDTAMLDAIFYRCDDPRVTHNINRKGMSVYQVKMNALKQLTGISPPKQISYKVDTSIINFYFERLRKVH